MDTDYINMANVINAFHELMIHSINKNIFLKLKFQKKKKNHNINNSRV